MDSVIDHLRALVGADTTNPPRAITPDHAALVYCARTLAGAGFDCHTEDLGDGCVNLIASRGTPSVIVNCHLDTVPVCAGWTADPFTLRIEGGHAIGLGACDIKGAAASILAASQRTDGDALILFSTDEETGSSRCVKSFLAGRAGSISGAIVCEPTGCAAVAAHRELLSVEAVFTGASGHASGATTQNAVHNAVRWSAAALNWRDTTSPDTRFSIGVIEGGVKPNMVAASARVRFGLRPAVGASAGEQFTALRALADGAEVSWTERFRGPALMPHADSPALAARLGAPAASPVDFWTEASLFAQAGVPAVVFGPGSIAYAHARDERVPLVELERATDCFARLFSGGAS